MVYAACGVKPGWLLPIQVDTGTNNKTLLDDPLYVGLKRERRGHRPRRPMIYFIRWMVVRWFHRRVREDALVLRRYTEVHTRVSDVLLVYVYVYIFMFDVVHAVGQRSMEGSLKAHQTERVETSDRRGWRERE